MDDKVAENPYEKVGKTIIVCCDGTAFSAYARRQESPYTNVSRISRSINSTTKKGKVQVVHYVPGIGTTDGNPSNHYNQGIGRGIDEKIIDAYSFICHNYVGEEDHIVLIGFSRGAFIVRCIADFIYRAGLLTKKGLYYLYPVYDKWSKENLPNTAKRDSRTPDGPHQSTHGSTNVNELYADLERKQLLRREIHTKVCAVWDTVSSLGFPRLGLLPPRPMNKLRFVNSDLCEGIDHAFQALALHEHRQPFLPVVWRLPRGADEEREGTARLRQCWFMGYHGDIGGGNKVESLAPITLAWMMGRLKDFIEFDEESFWKPRPEDLSWSVSEVPSNDPKKYRSSGKQSLNTRPGSDPRFSVIQEGVKGKIKAHVQESMTLLYWLSGSVHREPRRQFWTCKRYENDHNPDNNISSEYMHVTVRLIRQLEALESCKTLRGVTPQKVGDGTWSWTIQGLHQKRWWKRFRQNTADNPVTYQVFEDKTNDVEVSLLSNWIKDEIKILQESSEENDISQDHYIFTLQDWLM